MADPVPAPTVDLDWDLTPKQNLVVEVLIARARLGEHVWTFSSRHTPAVRQCEAKGFVQWWKSAPVEHAILVRPSHALLAYMDAHPYAAPALAELSVLRAREAQVRELAYGGNPSRGHQVNPEYRTVTAGALLAVLDGTTGSGKTG